MIHHPNILYVADLPSKHSVLFYIYFLLLDKICFDQTLK